ncbi:MAG: HD-like signal output (HDOD) protein [Myxococcota bacterium]
MARSKTKPSDLEHVVLDESCDALIDATIRVMSESIRKRTQARPLLEAMMSSVNRRDLPIPVISTTLTRVVELTKSDDVCIDKLTLAVEMDPALVTKLLGISNSALLRGNAPVRTVHEALMRMGIGKAKQVVIGLALRSAVLRSPAFQEEADELWRHAVLTGLACNALLEKSEDWRDIGFLLGLVHDIGHSVVLCFLSDPIGRKREFRRITDAAIDATRAQLHANLGALSIQAWKFPDAFITAVLNHHNPEVTSAEHQELTWALHTADILAKYYEAEHRSDAEVDDSREPTEQDDAALIAALNALAEVGMDEERAEILLSKMEGGFKAFASLA